LAGYVVLALSAGGCLNLSAARIQVSGEVTLDGEPVKAGTITFHSLAGSVETMGTITDGQFQIPPEQGPLAGENRIEIHWPRTSAAESGTDVPETTEAIPPDYNTKTNLVADLQRNVNVLRLHLNSR
jgi:hypothetical protein